MHYFEYKNEQEDSDQMICEGHTVNIIGSVRFAYKDGKDSDSIGFTQMNTTGETHANSFYVTRFMVISKRKRT